MLPVLFKRDNSVGFLEKWFSLEGSTFESESIEKEESFFENSSQKETELLTDDNFSSGENEEPSLDTEIDYSKLTYSALGDSITAGLNNYPTVVGKILGLKNSFNKGIGGTTISNYNNGMIDRYDQISLDSDIISIQGGINDSRSVPLGTIDSFDESTFMGAYNSLIKKVKERYPDSFVFLISMPKTYNSITLDIYVKGNEYGYNYLDYAHAIYEIAEKWNLPVLDLYLDSFTEDTKQTDGCHPSQFYINEVLAPSVADFIEINYEEYLKQHKAD